MKRILTCLLGGLLLPVALATAAPAFSLVGEPELLDPTEAYRVAVTADRDRLEVVWRIADGYYLYRDKLGFASASDGVTLGEAALPMPTEIKDDAFFGKMAIYRGDVTITVPYSGQATGDILALDVKAQGCADIGICYPPETRRVDVALPVAASGSGSGGLGVLAQLGQRLGFGAQEPEFLEVDQAFVLSAEATPEGDAVITHWQIADGYYLYRDKFGFSTADDAIQLGTADLPKGKTKNDPYFGKMEIYTGEVAARVPLDRSDPAPGPLTFTATYQGCAEGGICYPPQTRDLAISLPLLSTAQAATVTPALTRQTSTPAPASLSEQDSIAASLARGTSLLTVLSFFGFGLLLSFTPCVFPMIPILSGIIVGQGTTVTTRRAFTLSVVYVLAMAMTYTVAGVLAGLFGSNLQATFQNPWILGTFAALFVVLAMSMFGLYDLQVPNWAQSRLSASSNRQKSGNLTGVAVMGFLSALIVGPCVAAPLAGALIYIGQTGDALLGGVALFALSLGMGTPLLLIGASAGKLLPKAGPWMDVIKAIFGVLLIGVAIWMLERILPASLTMTMWAALLIVSAIYLGALDHLSPGGHGWRRLWKGAGLVMLLYGAVLLVGAASGGRDVFQPLRGIGVGQSGLQAGALPTRELAFQRIKGVDELRREVALASDRGQGVMLDFYADWCITCKEMEHETFSDPGVQARLADVVLLQADVTDNDDIDRALLKEFGLIGPPTIMFFDRDGNERRDFRVMGFMNATDFSRQIDSALR
ncbi:MAG: thiol:disulfide interchange protein [Gammaproteobacteria bacterium]|nr:MAG: thiol:disulfide interchange protein [Gammaproteobacteria bacterium]